VLRRFGLVFVAVGVLFAAIWMGRVIHTGVSLVSHLDQARSLASGGLDDVDPLILGDLIIEFRADVVDLKRRAGWLAPLGALFRWVPSVGPLLDQAPALLSLADGGTRMAVLFWEDLAPSASSASSIDLSFVKSSLPLLAANIREKRDAAIQIRHAYRQIDCSGFPETYRGPCTQVAPWVELLPDVVQRLGEVPELAGFEGPQVYLLLALNEDELRPGGGFISGVGEIWIENGEVNSLEFRDSYAVDDFSQPYPVPPWPLQRFMGLDLWVFRDSNWSPDFPTAVEDALPLYRTGSQPDIDGVVAADQKAVQALVGAIGPLNVPNAEDPVDADNVIDYMHSSWSPEDEEITREWWHQRKAFMGDLAMAMMSRLQDGTVDWMALAETMMLLIESKDLQIAMMNPEMRTFLAEQQWDGGLHRGSRDDYILVVEANVGYNKASRKIDRALRYEVDLSRSPVQAALQMTYTHTSEADLDCKAEARYDLDYAGMMDRCYWAFIRTYVPPDAVLLQASEHPIPANKIITGEAWHGHTKLSETKSSSGRRFTVFSQAFLLPTSEKAIVRYVYQLPEDVVISEESERYVYRLILQKQPGVPVFPARVILRTPQNAIVSHMQPDTCLRDNSGLVSCQLDVDRDRTIEIHYQISGEARP
jgi:hypothetical protein